MAPRFVAFHSIFKARPSIHTRRIPNLWKGKERERYIYIFIEFRYVGVNYVNRNRERFSVVEKNVKINEKHRAELMDTFKNRRRATPPSLLIKPVFPSTRIWNGRPGLWTRWFV